MIGPSGGGNGLADDAHRLAHLLHAHDVPVEVVAAVAGGDFKIVLFVTAIGLRLAQVPLLAGRPQHRSGDAECLAIVDIQNPDVAHAVHPDAVGRQQLFILVGLGQEDVAEVEDVLFEAVVGFVQQPADAERVRGQARAAVFLEDVQRQLAFPHAVEQRRDGADVEGVRAQPDEVAGDAVQFGENDADRLRARRRLDAEQFFDRQAVAEAVGDRGDVVHAVHVGGELLIGPVLAEFFNAAVQVADHAVRAEDLFAVELQDYAQHAVRGGVLRPHVQDEFGGIEEGLRPSLIVRSRSPGSPEPSGCPLRGWCVLAQREPGPFVRQEDAAQIGVAIELHSEHIEDLAFQPVRRGVQVHAAAGAFAILDPDLHADALIAGKAIQHMDDIEGCFALGPVHRRDVDQVVEFIEVAQRFQHVMRGAGLGDE